MAEKTTDFVKWDFSKWQAELAGVPIEKGMILSGQVWDFKENLPGVENFIVCSDTKGKLYLAGFDSGELYNLNDILIVLPDV